MIKVGLHLFHIHKKSDLKKDINNICTTKLHTPNPLNAKIIENKQAINVAITLILAIFLKSTSLIN